MVLAPTEIDPVERDLRSDSELESGPRGGARQHNADHELQDRRATAWDGSKMRSLALHAVAALCVSPVRAQFEQMFSQMFGENVQFEVQGGGGQAPIPQEPSEEFRWLRGTKWNWNNWREVEFDPSGRFKAPTEDCEQGQCRWASDESHVYVQWGQAGLHKLAVKGEEAVAEKGTVLEGVRMQDDDPVSATFVGKTKEQEDAD